MKKRPEENAMKRMSILIFAAVFAWFGLYGAPNAFGVVPAPDGGYPNFTTAEGQNALLSLTSGLATQQLARFRSRALPPAALTPALAPDTLAVEHRRQQYSHRRCGTLTQYHRYRQHGQWNSRACQ